MNDDFGRRTIIDHTLCEITHQVKAERSYCIEKRGLQQITNICIAAHCLRDQRRSTALKDLASRELAYTFPRS